QCCTTAVGRSPSPDFTVASTPSTCPAYESKRQLSITISGADSQDEITADPSTSQQTVPHIARALACRKGAV
ncbi:unnamed protein product, partial [Dicrocoelium dendriticum]